MGKVIRKIPEFKVKYNDVFHLKNLYIMLHEYLAEEGWFGDVGPQEHPTNSHLDVEKFYLQRDHQKGLHRGGKETWVWWRLKKNPVGKNQGYYTYNLEIDMHGQYFQKLEIMHQGKKIKVDKGEIEIIFRPTIVRTGGGEDWSKHWLLKHFQDFYEKRILSYDLDKMEKELWREGYRMSGVIKAYLNLRNFIPVPEPFHPRLYGMEGQIPG